MNRRTPVYQPGIKVDDRRQQVRRSPEKPRSEYNALFFILLGIIMAETTYILVNL